MPAGGGQTDDRGEYRVWGLNPGEYYVSAVPPNLPEIGNRGGPPRRCVARGGPTLALRGAGRGRAGAGAEAAPETDPVGYAPTYYPGVPSPNEARTVSVGLGAEAAGIDFSVLLVRTSRIAGRVTDPDGSPAWSATSS